MSYASVIQTDTNGWKVSGPSFRDILPTVFSDKTIAIQVATAINEAHRYGRNEVRFELRSLIGSPHDPEDCQ